MDLIANLVLSEVKVVRAPSQRRPTMGRLGLKMLPGDWAVCWCAVVNRERWVCWVLAENCVVVLWVVRQV